MVLEKFGPFKIISSLRDHSVTYRDEVVTEFLDRVRSRARLYRRGVVCHEKSLLCLDDDDAFSSLQQVLKPHGQSECSVTDQQCARNTGRTFLP